MTEKVIRELANQFGLSVDKRITTGNEEKHFAVFELFGPIEQVFAAAPVFKAQSPKGSAALLYGNNKGHSSYRKPYIELQSIWCE